ncbi:superoxide dismutase [Ni], partial [Nocardioides luteus]|uniref:superoxide dismutase [Ni] n=1 Tax=Nocardioides luteus TaxID=1844 RepID=UPI004032CBE6
MPQRCRGALAAMSFMRSSVASSRTHEHLERTRMFARLFAPTIEVSAHCDLPCGVYDPA